MKAMILAAGEGQRMRPLTNNLPKPLLPILGKPLVAYHLEALAAIGVTQVVMNVSYLADMLMQDLGDGSAFGVQIQYVREPKPLETAGGIRNALEQLGHEPFICINADVWTTYDFTELLAPSDALADLVMVSNPSHHPQGDFCLPATGVGLVFAQERLAQESSEQEGIAATFAGISRIDPRLLMDFAPTDPRLGQVLRHAIRAGQVQGRLIDQEWCDVGTPERYAQLHQQLLERNL